MDLVSFIVLLGGVVLSLFLSFFIVFWDFLFLLWLFLIIRFGSLFLVNFLLGGKVLVWNKVILLFLYWCREYS